MNKRTVSSTFVCLSRQVAACSFNKGKLTMLSSNFDKTVGGRTFDEAIATFFCEDFAKRYKLDVRSNKKATLKLLSEVEKLKKQMSASTHKLPLNIECFMNNLDVKGGIERCINWEKFFLASFADFFSSVVFETVLRILQYCVL